MHRILDREDIWRSTIQSLILGQLTALNFPLHAREGEAKVHSREVGLPLNSTWSRNRGLPPTSGSARGTKQRVRHPPHLRGMGREDKANQPTSKARGQDFVLGFSSGFNSQFEGKTSGHDLPPWFISQSLEFSENTGEANTEGTCPPQSIRELRSCLFTKALKPKKSLYFI